MAILYAIRTAFLAILLVSVPAAANWQTSGADVDQAIRDERVAGVLIAMPSLDEATITGDRTAFAALLADDLAVNNPQNGVSVRGGTAQRSAAGRISYSRYDRVIEYAGVRGDMVILMGEEIVQPRDAPEGTAEVHRRFTDLWKQVDGRWLLTARQSTIITRP